MHPIRLALKLGNDRRGHGNLGPFAVLPGDEILVGRAADNGLRLEPGWTPRVLARLEPSGDHWLLINGPSGDVEVRNASIKSRRVERFVGKGEARRSKTVTVGATFTKGAAIALPTGETVAEWTIFDDNIRLKIVVGGDVTGLRELAPEAGATPRRLGPSEYARGVGRARREVLTRPPDVTAGHLTARQCQVMAVVFAHLLEDQPRPPDLAKAAAPRLGLSVDAVKKHLRDVRKKVNAVRDGWDLASLDELGELLVEKAKVITLEDLHAAQRDRLDAAIVAARRSRRNT